jgi:hypothetical protein
MLEAAIGLLKDSQNNGDAGIILKRFFLLECHNNRKILAMINWKNSTPEMIRALSLEFKTDAARAVIGFVNRDPIEYLFSAFADIEDKESNVNRIIAIITKIEAIQVIARIDPNGQMKYNKFKQRINNFEKLVEDIIQHVDYK